MRTTIDIADDEYSDLKALAAQEHTSVRALLAETIKLHLLPRIRRKPARDFHWPLIGNPSGKTLYIDNDLIERVLSDETIE